MNLLFFLTPKQDVLYIYEDFTLRQTLEKWSNQRYATIPVLKRNGEYVGSITEGDILAAIHRPLGARTIDMVKLRTRAGMGRCQGGFCGSKVVEILARELGQELDEITKCGGESKILFGRTK